MRTPSRGWWSVISLVLAGAAVAAAWTDWRIGWVTPAFDFVAHQFYEVPILARIRRPSQLLLVRARTWQSARRWRFSGSRCLLAWAGTVARG